jgi:hypothetical protein
MGKNYRRRKGDKNMKISTKGTKEMSLFGVTKPTNARKCHGQMEGYPGILNKCVL